MGTSMDTRLYSLPVGVGVWYPLGLVWEWGWIFSTGMSMW